MGNPSEWASEVKKGLFRIFQNFFRKIMVFQWKNENGRKMAKKYRKWNFLDSRHGLQLLLSPKSLKMRFLRFWQFYAIFCDFLFTYFKAKSKWERPKKINFFCRHPLAGISNNVLKPKNLRGFIKKPILLSMPFFRDFTLSVIWSKTHQNRFSYATTPNFLVLWVVVDVDNWSTDQKVAGARPIGDIFVNFR